MSDESGVPTGSEPSIESRMAAALGGEPKPVVASQQPVEQQPEPVSADEPQADQEQDEADQSDEPQEEADVLEHLGKQYNVPKSLKTAFEEQRAFATRVAQETASVRRAVEADRIALQATAAFQQQITPVLAKLEQLKSYKEQAKAVNWAELTLDQKVDLDRELRNVDNQISDLTGRISQGFAHHQQQIGQAVLSAVGETEQFMSQRVQGWNAERGNELHQYGAQMGIPKEKLITGWFADPTATLALWKSMQWDRLQASKPGVTNKASGAPPVIRPTSNAAQQSTANAKFSEARQRLKKSGSLEDAAAVFLRMK